MGKVTTISVNYEITYRQQKININYEQNHHII